MNAQGDDVAVTVAFGVNVAESGAGLNVGIRIDAGIRDSDVASFAPLGLDVFDPVSLPSVEDRSSNFQILGFVLLGEVTR